MTKKLLGAAKIPVLVGCSLSLMLGACGGGADDSSGNNNNGTAGTNNSGLGGATGTGGSQGIPTSGAASAYGGAPGAYGGTSNAYGGVPGAYGGAQATYGGTTNANGGTFGATAGTSNANGGVSAGGRPNTGGAGTGTAGTSASAGGTGGGTPSACGVSPVTPNASQQTKNLLCYLYSIKGNHVLSGQQEANWNNPPTDLSFYANNGMKNPAILGSDFLYRGNASCSAVSASTTRAIAYWNAGGLTMFRYHMGIPGAGLTCTSDCYQSTPQTPQTPYCSEPLNKPNAAFFTNVVTAGTPENTSLNAKLDYVAVQIAAMKAANVPVILAIYHETQPNGWFWWAMTGSGQSFVNLWTYTFNYLTKTKGLNNIIWLMPFSGAPNAAFYPKGLVDIGGPDEYIKPGNLATFNASANYGPALNIFGNTMPIALHETGAVVQPNSMFPSAAPWVLWNVWAGFQTMTAYNTVASMQAAYASQYTITRDEIPNLK